MHLHTIKTNEKRGHRFARDQQRYMGRKKKLANLQLYYNIKNQTVKTNSIYLNKYLGYS